jgi:cleavage stimulation factor subunit 3
MIDDRSRDYMSVRKLAKEYENVTRNLDRQSPGLPPQGTPDELRQKYLWRKYVEWEKSNPPIMRTNPGMALNSSGSDETTTSPASLHLIAKRVMYAYEQWLLAMPTHPDIWVEYAAYLQDQAIRMTDKSSSSDVGVWARVYSQEAVQVFERAVTVCSSQLVHFAYADFEEVDKL